MPRTSLKVLILSFPLSGLVTTQLGPLLPVLTARWFLNDARAGQLFLAQFLSSTAGALSSGWLMAKAGAERLIGVCYIAMAAAILSLGWVSRPVGMLAIACYGLALGVSIPAFNLLAGSGPGEVASSVTRLNLLNMAWSAGAVLGPPAIVFLLGGGGFRLVLGVISGLCALAGTVCVVLLSRAAPPSEFPGRQKRDGLPLAAAIMTACFLFLYVGVESGLNGWLPVFAERVARVSAPMAAAAVSVFWACILAARLVTASASDRASPRFWLFAGLVTAISGIITLTFAGSPGLIIGAAVAGLGLGPIFPTAVAMYERRTGAIAARFIGFVFAAGGCGGGVLPWLIGAASSTTGDLRAGLSITLVATVGMMLLAIKL